MLPVHTCLVCFGYFWIGSTEVAVHDIWHRLTIDCNLMLTACNCHYGWRSLMQLDGLPCWQKLPASALSVQIKSIWASLLSLFSTGLPSAGKQFLDISCTGCRETFCHHSFTEASTARLKCFSSGFKRGLDVLGVRLLSKDQ